MIHEIMLNRVTKNPENVHCIDCKNKIKIFKVITKIL